MGIRKSIALKWDREKDDAPRLIAAGKGPLADRIVSLALEAGIPVQQNGMLTEALIDTATGSEIPPELYQLAAEVYIFLMKLEKSEAGNP
ncbi:MULTISPECIES: EscU/YscU/HrcU family type III secretion system export apparatus switch protein [unclassified Oceanispirochaeta]|uniref:EscU/YscU/HrcU family type III secretion system export apparatus switch protein n=1 Tax=unclassified Oceanispirochaeta TaxID=2635722 RepID=UPI000E08F03B|nr:MULTISPECIES: EscU/YscU/HrcU family type III secretion system export apparatus switch protein [unclassified Oceanispirochaeta]MBF9018575.1 EscU/YscU/HrcU family type III secretion system export apparatus switch protein [Oceanispirochaeta sp. M2]NPD75018.1 flagellar biosynthesis [Oceanispirochaeta sp. M1]RDG29139.1 flagellar biosynthesis [Oceanispirochaeta sp. M1]